MKIELGAEAIMLIKEMEPLEVGAAVKAFISKESTEATNGMARVLYNILSAKAAKVPKPKKWIYADVPPIPNSPYGDGKLHRLCVAYNTKHPDKYKKETYKEFLAYWTSKVQSGLQAGRERWVCEKTFEVGGRLATWEKNNKNWNAEGKTKKEDYLQQTADKLNKLFN
jgi:hypothetical protein